MIHSMLCTWGSWRRLQEVLPPPLSRGESSHPLWPPPDRRWRPGGFQPKWQRCGQCLGLASCGQRDHPANACEDEPKVWPRWALLVGRSPRQDLQDADRCALRLERACGLVSPGFWCKLLAPRDGRIRPWPFGMGAIQDSTASAFRQGLWLAVVAAPLALSGLLPLGLRGGGARD